MARARNAKPAGNELTPKQEAFVIAYVETSNATEAYRRSYNISPTTKAATINRKAIEVLRNGKVAARIAQLNSKAEKRAELDRAWVLERLMRNARIAMGEEKIKVAIRPRGPDGKLLDGTVELEVSDRDVSGANRALELLGKEIGMFVDRSEVDLSVSKHEEALALLEASIAPGVREQIH